MSTYTQADVRCPFYITDTERPAGISCEGISDKSKLSLCFTNKRYKKVHMKVFCIENYEDCALFKTIYKKYEE